MPQEIRVLCCYKCKIYQVDIVKKTTKWQCKLCAEKQSVFKEFFRGTGVQCRQKVQELNLSKNVEFMQEENELLHILENNDLEIDLGLISREEQKHQREEPEEKESKWTQYLDDSKESSSDFIQIPQQKIIKRKNNSNFDDTNKLKSAKSTSSVRSKWDAYL